MLIPGTEPLKYEDLIESVRLTNNPIKTEIDLNATEALLI
jgi:hypothetical protein